MGKGRGNRGRKPECGPLQWREQGGTRWRGRVVSLPHYTPWTLPSPVHPRYPQKGLTHSLNTICLHTASDRSSFSYQGFKGTWKHLLRWGSVYIQCWIRKFQFIYYTVHHFRDPYKGSCWKVGEGGSFFWAPCWTSAVRVPRRTESGGRREGVPDGVSL